MLFQAGKQPFGLKVFAELIRHYAAFRPFLDEAARANSLLSGRGRAGRAIVTGILFGEPFVDSGDALF